MIIVIILHDYSENSDYYFMTCDDYSDYLVGGFNPSEKSESQLG